MLQAGCQYAFFVLLLYKEETREGKSSATSATNATNDTTNTNNANNAKNANWEAPVIYRNVFFLSAKNFSMLKGTNVCSTKEASHSTA